MTVPGCHIVTLMIQLYIFSSPSSRDHLYYMIQNNVVKKGNKKTYKNKLMRRHKHETTPNT